MKTVPAVEEAVACEYSRLSYSQAKEAETPSKKHIVLLHNILRKTVS